MIEPGDRVYLTPNAGAPFGGKDARVHTARPNGDILVKVDGYAALLLVSPLGYIPYYKAEPKKGKTDGRNPRVR